LTQVEISTDLQVGTGSKLEQLGSRSCSIPELVFLHREAMAHGPMIRHFWDPAGLGWEDLDIAKHLVRFEAERRRSLDACGVSNILTR